MILLLDNMYRRFVKMKFGKKFLSLLMGVAVLCVSILPAFAADVDTIDCDSVSYDYVRI